MQKILFITILVALASFTNAASTPTVNLVVTYPNGHREFQFGDMVTYTTSVAPVGNGTTTPPTGTVNIVVDGTQRATCQLLSSPPTNIVCAVNETMTPALTVGAHNFTSFYLGDQNYNAADSGVQTLRVVAVPTITLSISPANPTTTQAITVTVATTSTNPPNQASSPTGTVTFTANGNPLSGTCTLTSGGCTFTIPANTLNQGSVTLVGGYSGDTNFAPVNVSTTFTVGTATTATTASTTAATTATTASSTTTTASTVATATTTGSNGNTVAAASTVATTGSDNTAATASTATTTGSSSNTGASTQANNGGSTAFTGTTSGAVTVCGSVFLTLLAAAIAL